MPYLKQIHQAIPRLLSLYDTDKTSKSYGLGDRFHWAWGLIDYGNGTFQGAANGLSRLLVNKLLPEGMDENAILQRIESMFHGANRLRRRDGSLEEAFPYEGSFCVTALVAYDLLTALELLEDRITNEKRNHFISIVRPMIGFLHRFNETHAFISNHLATAIAALVKWMNLTDEKGDIRGQQLLEQILQRQSSEGWFCEYEGADPGYQSLCTYYLADVHRMRPNWNLLEPLSRSIHFLWHFAHPDGSFGGVYGSRNTRFYYPAGVEFLAPEIQEASALAHHMQKAIEAKRVVTLSAMDEPNLIPMFNAYCWAATFQDPLSEKTPIPCFQPPFRKHFPESGLLIDRGEKHYTIISTHKGGVTYHFLDNKIKLLDAGLVSISNSGKQASTQTYIKSNPFELEQHQLIVNTNFFPIPRALPSPLQFLLLRVLNLTLMRSTYFREKIKQILVKYLITRKGKSVGRNQRIIKWGEDLKIKNLPRLGQGYKLTPKPGLFSTIHMASQGYWQQQDDAKLK